MKSPFGEAKRVVAEAKVGEWAVTKARKDAVQAQVSRQGMKGRFIVRENLSRGVTYVLLLPKLP